MEESFIFDGNFVKSKIYARVNGNRISALIEKNTQSAGGTENRKRPENHTKNPPTTSTLFSQMKVI